MARDPRNPRLLAAFFGSLLAGVAGVVDVWGAAGDGARRRRSGHPRG